MEKVGGRGENLKAKPFFGRNSPRRWAETGCHRSSQGKAFIVTPRRVTLGRRIKEKNIGLIWSCEDGATKAEGTFGMLKR